VQADEVERRRDGRWQDESGGLEHSSRQGPPVLDSRELVLFVGVKARVEDVVDDDCVEVEVELDDDELHPSSYLAMARFYSGKRFSKRGLFEEMRIDWGMSSLVAPKVLGDNKYLLEFDREDVRDRVVNGGPW
jgi:hypothetical protein